MAAAILLGLSYGVPGGADLSRWATAVTVAVIVLLLLASLAVVLVAWLRPRGRR
jgi:hypothetical protein